jgi:molecular chaperone HtpG
MEKMEFKTEVKQLLDLMIHSLYTNKEIFLRELLSNASDAIDKARYESLTNSDILEGEEEWKIKIIPDKEKKTLTIRDNGTGMTEEEIIRELGTIAHSGTKEFLKTLKEKDIKDNPELIGQFGVGFYSSFMVADKVTVISRKAGVKNEIGTKWESGADETFTVEEVEKEHKGTDVILHLKEDEQKYLESWEIKHIIRKYSDYIEHPIVMDVEKTDEKDTKKIEEEILNSQKAIWLRSRSDITDSEYNEFYKHLSRDISEPARVIHYKAEGTSEFTALLYIPGKKPFDIFYRDFKYGPTLYVKRVQIMSDCEELLPVYLRFVKGVVDSSDLPLNISREILQNNRQVEIIKNNLTKKVIDTLSEMKKDQYEKYLEFYKEFGKILKEGIHYDFSKKETLSDLLLLQSTKTDSSSFTTFEKYVENMKEGQEEIYYITGMSRDEVINSPYLEAFKEKDYEVLIMLEEVDDIIMNSLYDYKGKKVKSVTKGDIKLDKTEEVHKETEKKKYEKLIDFMKEHLKNDVKDVRLSGRLKDSICCLVADEGDMDPQMEKILQAMGQSVPGSRRILEINPVHKVVEAMNKIFEENSNSELLKEYTLLLYDQALLLEGSKPKDPVLFSKAITKLMAENVNQ